MEDIYLRLFNDLYTVDDVELFRSNIDEFIAKTFEMKHGVEEKLDGCFSGSLTKEWMALFDKKMIDLDNPEKIQKFVLEVKVLLDDLRVVGLLVAWNIPQDVIKKMSLWFETNFGEKVIMDIKLDRFILGGLVVLDNGKQHDYSLIKQLERMGEKGDLKLSSLLGD